MTNLFKQYHNKEFLNQIAQDKEQLNKSIEETGGFVLYLMEQNKILPQIDFFFNDDNMSVYAVQFVLKNYKNFSTEQQRVLVSLQNQYQNYDYETDEYKAVAYEEDNSVAVEHDIEYYLKNKLSLPKQATLTFELIQTYHKEIHAILANEDIATERVVKKSMKGFTIEQFFALDKSFVKKHPYMFDYFPQYFSNSEFKAYFKEVMLDPKSKFKPGLHNFQNYIFEKEDKELLYSLIEGRYSQQYKDIVSLHGATDLISKMEFFNRLSPLDISYFTDEELIENKEAIRERWLKGFDKEGKQRRRDEFFSKILQSESSLEQFKIVFTPEFFTSLAKNAEDLDPHSVYRDDEATRKKVKYFNDLGFNYMIQNPKEYYKFNLDHTIHNLFENYFRREDKVEKAKLFYNTVIPEALKQQGFLNLTGKYNSTINQNSIEFISDIVKNHPSINLLYVLLNTHDYLIEDNKKEYVPKKLKECINELIPLVNGEDAKQLVEAFNYKKPITIFYNNNNARGSESVNFLNHNNNLNTIDKYVKSIVLDVDKKLLSHILKNNVILSNDDYAKLLKNSESDKETFKFIKQYTQKNKENILSNDELVSQILQHSKSKEIIVIDNSENEEKAYEQYIRNFDNLLQLENIYKKLNKKDEAEREVIYQKKNTLETENRELSKKLSLSFIEHKIDVLFKEKNFKCLNALSHTQSFDHQRFNDYVSRAPFEDIINSVQDDSFMELCSYKMGYNDESNFSFAEYNIKQTYELAQKVFSYLEKNEENFTRSNKEKIIRYFKTANKEGLKEFFIDYLSNEIFYSYSLRDFIGKNNYTNEQILRAYVNAEKTNFFSDQDVNARFCHTLSDFFNNNEAQYLEMLALTKETYPKFYLLLTYNDVGAQFSEKNEQMTKDESKMHYYVQHFDEKAILKGVDIIFDEMKQGNPEYNQKLAASVITQVIYNSYYDKDIGNSREYFTLFSDERVHDLIVNIWQKAPLFILERHRVGLINNIGQYIASHIKEFDNDNMPLSFIYPDFNVRPEYLRLDNDEHKHMVIEIFNAFMDFYTVSSQYDKLDYMIFLIERAKFIEENINYGSKPENLHFNSSDSIVEIIMADDATMDRIKNYKLKSMLDTTVEVQEAKPKKSKKI
jgi:hypothetical protein